MRPIEQAEFEALRATIRERGTARIVLFFAVVAVWAALVVATTAAFALPIASLLPLLVLAAGFEATSSLHIGVERIGRYIQTAHEPRIAADQPGSEIAGPLWETTAMQFGGRGRAIGSDALFSVVYVLAAAVNFLFVLVALTAVGSEMIGLGAAHAMFLWRVLTLRRAAAGQRDADLKVFRELLAGQRDRQQ
ncbi:MAG: hypothetical protein ACRD09_12640 [Vicinamibacterales bacterium]